MQNIFHSDFKLQPFWWEAYKPQSLPETALPKDVSVAVIGAGYAGLSAALELAKGGVDVLVLDAAEPGFGASTRSGGMVSGGVNVGKRYFTKAMSDEEAVPFLNDASDAFAHVENLIAQHKIDCGWHKMGTFQGAWCEAHYKNMAKKVALLNAEAGSGSYVVPREQQREQIGSDYYHGGMVVERAAHLHPALYFKGLLDLATKAGVKIAAKTALESMSQNADESWTLKTSRGELRCRDVIVCTNGYTGNATPEFKRRVVPIGSYIIATEELSPDLAASLSPKNRSFADSRRVLTYYRLSPDGKRLIFGGRAKFGFTDPRETAPLLYQFMIDRYPQLKGTKITHSWTGNVAFGLDEMSHMGKLRGMHYALACNGSGIAMLSYLGHQTGLKILRKSNRICAYDRDEFPTHPLYTGNTWFLPLLGAYFRSRDWIDRKFN
ncbi:NAD(P)/FAD-dependent oxidoreductase [Aestuariivirga litoralis]|uniref:NAD(P)/FAD-dependent oxidoreductase n=1 Tax=Aestuariivirga litoralis TaxID=2650924 RepID=UPI0018C755D8|nr:FAD-binding oxidoreductase [Aestuariivirga litoralis]MBG1231937.1 FAD-binding oxidoreductase [Aestuariivirga litoralis]